jgi:hypothetical protein
MDDAHITSAIAKLSKRQILDEALAIYIEDLREDNDEWNNAIADKAETIAFTIVGEEE